MTVSKDLVAASATPLVLSILSEGESYGYAIIKRVHDLSGGQMQWTDGMLYPVLHRLEKQKLIQSKWRKSKTGRKPALVNIFSPVTTGIRVLRRTSATASMCSAWQGSSNQ